jgi:hypothetical protein
MHMAFADCHVSVQFSKWFAMREDGRPPRSAQAQLACRVLAVSQKYLYKIVGAIFKGAMT